MRARHLYLVPFLLALFCVALPVQAGEESSEKPLREQLQEQESRIADLERLLQQQTNLLERLQQQLAEQGTQPRLVRVSATGPAVQGPPPAQEMARISTELDALAETDKKIEDKVAKLEEKTSKAETNALKKLKGLGNFSFSGDLRLRYEPFFGGTLSYARHRERFRARFNINAKFSDELRGGLRIATGNELDPISTNQTMTSFFQRKPIAIDRAFLTYRPKWLKPLTLTGGKFGITWYRTQLTFDSDLNPEGISETLSFDFKNPIFKRLTLVGFQLPFHESSGAADSFLFGGQVGSQWKFGDRLKFSGYAAFYNWHLADPIQAAKTGGKLKGSSNTNAASADQFASNFALVDLIGRFDIDTGSSRWPLMLQLDFVNNTRACGNETAVAVACNPKDRTGWWAEAQVGQTTEPHDVKFGYTFIRIEQEAVLSAFNFSDLRSPTNVATHRFNFGYKAYNNLTLNYTLLVGRRLQTALFPTDEDWLKRMQFDVVYKF